jgi:pyrimidine operon attenuation protein/uracil phosphoribosyltransferase
METAQTKNEVLDKNAVIRKMKRIALEIAEQNIDEKLITIAGIKGNGEVVARLLAAELNRLGIFTIEQMTIVLDKKNPLHVNIEGPENIEEKVVIIVDDVANTGRTMLYALKPFLEARPKKIQTMALVERSHKLFPIQTDYTGLSITTTLQEHIVVETSGDEISGAFLY